MKNLLLTITALFIFSINAVQARKIKSTQPGGFTASSTWVGSVTPAAGDTITIDSSHTVVVSSNLSYSGTKMKVIIYGTLNFSGGGSKLKMPSGSSVQIMSGGSLTSTGSGGGSSKTIEASGTTLWSGSMGTITGPAYVDQNTPLPVTLLTFNTKTKNGAVSVTWSTASETNNDYFEVERSIDGGQYKTIAQVKANGNIAGTYEYIDQIQSSNCIYRLSQTDYNGTRTELSYSSLNASKLTNMSNITATVWPNPSVNGNSTIRIEGNTEPIIITITDLTGKKVFEKTTTGNTFDLAGSTQNPGIYMISIKQNDIIISSKTWMVTN